MSTRMVRQVDFLSFVSDDEKHVFSVSDKINSSKITAKILNSPIDFVFDMGASVNV